MKSKVASWIRANREKKSMSQQQLAERVGITQPIVSLWENGALNPNNDMLEKLSAVLEADLDPSFINVDLGEWLLEQREKSGLTRDQLAEKAGISPLTIYFIEKGTTKSPQEATLKGLQKALGKLPAALSKDVEEAREAGAMGEYLGPFPIEKWEENVGDKKIPCIYVFYDSLSRPVRIGETEDLARRMKEYQQYFWFKAPMIETFAYIIVKDSKFRSQAEKVMIKLVGKNAIFNIQDKI
jgi:transcriptional regulator with XRE-family HTH domain